MTDDGERIEATPVVVMAGDSSTPRLLGFLRLPPEGSGGHLDGGPDGAWSRNTLWLEGSGAGRFKREYSLEDFLVWMPSGTDGQLALVALVFVQRQFFKTGRVANIMQLYMFCILTKSGVYMLCIWGEEMEVFWWLPLDAGLTSMCLLHVRCFAA